jgi:hypothetical protein
MVDRNSWNLEAYSVPSGAEIERSVYLRFPKSSRGIDEYIITLHHLITDLQLSVPKLAESPI